LDGVDEIYEFNRFDRARVHGLLSLDRLALDGDGNGQTPGDYSISWSRIHGSGRVFYTALGHREDIWDPGYTEPGGRRNQAAVARQFQQHLLGGILWALGLAARLLWSPLPTDRLVSAAPIQSA
jgi:type 1 glutamine amidotransferase